jgi:hypothetical protein
MYIDNGNNRQRVTIADGVDGECNDEKVKG